MTYNLTKLFEIIIAFNKETSYFSLLDGILEKMMELTNADAGTLYIKDEGSIYTKEDDRLHFRIIRNKSLNVFQSASDKIDLPPIVLDPAKIDNICAYAAVKNEIISIDDVYQSDKFNFEGPKNYDKLTGYRTCSMLTIPMTSTVEGDHDVIGVIQLINAIDEATGKPVSFGNIYDPPVLPSIANIAANTLANLLHEQEVKDLFYSFVKVMTQAVDERSPYNSNHTYNVAEYCSRFAEYLTARFTDKEHEFYFSENRREQLTMAAFLHDIGKIITPLHIMDKADRLAGQLEIVRYKFEIKKYQTAAEHLSGKISGEEYNIKLAELQDALALVEEANNAGFLPDDKLEKIKRLESFDYIDSSGEPAPVLTEDNINALSVRKGTLTDEERSIMQEHVAVTERLLEHMKFTKTFKDVPAWAKGHHEFIDGTGYPQKLSDGHVTVEMCILTIMDIYEALTASDRPYKRAVPEEKALGILLEMAEEGKLHKELVELFAESEVWRKEQWTFLQNEKSV